MLKKFWCCDQCKIWRKSERLIKMKCVSYHRVHVEFSKTLVNWLFCLSVNLEYVIFSFCVWCYISKHRLTVYQPYLLKIKRALLRKICRISISLSSFLEVLYWKVEQTFSCYQYSCRAYWTLSNHIKLSNKNMLETTVHST